MTLSSLARINDLEAVVHPDILLGPIRPELIRNEVLADLLEDTARRVPDQIALIFADRSVTYRELNQTADRAASALIAAGVKPGHIVGLWLPRGIDLLIMQVAIAKAGAAWLPLDADTPVERIAVCLEDANAPGIVTCGLFSSKLETLDRSVWTIENLLQPTATPVLKRIGLLSTHPAYVIYTSGSTGKT